jgi:hypothetical protein
MLKHEPQPTPVSDRSPEPDVWRGTTGIDALIWADGQPYGPLDTCAQLCKPAIAGDAPVDPFSPDSK